MKEKSGRNVWMTRFEQFPILEYLLKWICITAVAGALIGSASALLLASLNWATDYRESHLWIIACLPLGGLLIGLMYHYWAGTAAKGNNFLIEEIRSSRNIIPFKMAPLVYVGTVLTHLFGGSAGREGTGVQMGGAIADWMSRLFRMHPYDRKIMVQIGISAGFASIFGTPLAGAVFGLEVIVVGRMRYDAIFPIFLSAFFAHFACHGWGIAHTSYCMSEVPGLDIVVLLWVLLASLIFGLVASAFSRSIVLWGQLAKRCVAYPPFRPLLGGVCIALCVWMLGTTKYIGLGVPTIVASFTEVQMWYDFLLKLLLTTFTIWFQGGRGDAALLCRCYVGQRAFRPVASACIFPGGIGLCGRFCRCHQYPNSLHADGHRALWSGGRHLLGRGLRHGLSVFRSYRHLHLAGVGQSEAFGLLETKGSDVAMKALFSSCYLNAFLGVKHRDVRWRVRNGNADYFRIFAAE